MKNVRWFLILFSAMFVYDLLFHYIGDFTIQQSGMLGIVNALLSIGVRDALKRTRPEPVK